MIQADNEIKKQSQSSLNQDFKDENERVKRTKKFPLKAGASSHNHSK